MNPPDKIYLIGFKDLELRRLISIFRSEMDRLKVRMLRTNDMQLRVDLAEDIEEIESHIHVLEEILEGKLPKTLTNEVFS